MVGKRKYIILTTEKKQKMLPKLENGKRAIKVARTCFTIPKKFSRCQTEREREREKFLKYKITSRR